MYLPPSRHIIQFLYFKGGGTSYKANIMSGKFLFKYILLFSALSLCFPLVGKSIYYTKNKDEADKTIYITKYRHEADEVIALYKYEYEADSASKWHITTNKEEADEIIYLVSNRQEVDKVVYICEDEE